MTIINERQFEGLTSRGDEVKEVKTQQNFNTLNQIKGKDIRDEFGISRLHHLLTQSNFFEEEQLSLQLFEENQKSNIQDNLTLLGTETVSRKKIGE